MWKDRVDDLLHLLEPGPGGLGVGGLQLLQLLQRLLLPLLPQDLPELLGLDLPLSPVLRLLVGGS